MTDPKFIHLRVHTAYSLSEGAIKIGDLISRLKEMGMPAVAMTDSGNMFGGKAISTYASEAGIKPILGCQFFLHNPDSDDILKSKGKALERDKFILLVQNETGYQNIMKLMKRFYLDNTQSGSEPELTYQDLEELNEGLIALTAGFEGPIGRLLLENRKDEANALTEHLHQIFGDRLYIELSRIGLPQEAQTEPDFIDLAYQHNIALVATNEAFFLDAEMYEAHDALICIAAGEIIANDDRKHYSVNNRLKTESEMLELFADLPEALENSVNIAKRCNYLSEKVKPLLPIFECPDGKSQDEYITEEAYKGLKERMEKQVYTPDMTESQKAEIDKKYFDRLEYELSVIKRMGFPGYFLIVSDFIRWSKTHGVPVGPGRGSGAGSIVAWSLKITELDPIKLELLFERFLNPDRVNMPDFDVDFCQENREKTIEYVQNKYGFDHVAQIITYGKLQAKNVIRDVARVMQMPYSQADKLSKMVPPPVQGKNVSLKQALEMVPELEQMRVSDPRINKLFDICMKLEGLYRQSGVHAAGVVIGDRPLDELVPLYKDPKAEMPVTQYDMKFVEETGLIKFDFLGLKTLTVIKKAVDWVEKTHGIKLDMETIPLDDKETYEMMQRGDTCAVFQFESPGMQNVHKQIKPDRFEDLIAIVSLYRPGPMDNIPTYIKRKHGEEQITYLHPALAPILDETYGIMVYQEQVMQIARSLAGYTMGEADKLRKVMGKKQIQEIPKQREKFMKGALANGIKEDIASSIFDQMEKFASYGFNKSHAAAYSLISYQTAYLKCHYPLEFMCAVMDLDITNTDKLLTFVADCKDMNFEVLPPNINKSQADFSVENGNIRYALGAVKGVSAAAMSGIVSEREKNGAFKNISDFCHRIDIKFINRKQLEQLIKAGAFDEIEKNRQKLFENIENILKHISASTETKTSAQSSLFGTEELSSEIRLKDAPDWPNLERLRMEAEAIGFYLSAHPLDAYKESIEKLGLKNCNQIMANIELGDKIQASVAACVENVQKRVAKTSGNKYAFVSLSDNAGAVEALIFSDGLAKYEHILTSGEPVLAKLSIEKLDPEKGPRVLIESVKTLDEAIAQSANGVIIYLNSIDAVQGLKQILSQDKQGANKVYLIPEIKGWDVKIELSGGYAFADPAILSKMRAVAGITQIKEI
ncbi:MAG TPA: DNA polymerase III subunit alpha [Alphaproteobacteria bacterium]|nr:DNA polymerase III subunit alpha [Alphaproteobacteria bacterium]